VTDQPVPPAARAASAARAARAAAQRLSGEFGPRLVIDVETALYSPDGERHPAQYFDPLELAGLIVSIASLSWQVYDTRRKKGEKPTAPVLAREVRVIQRERTGLDGTTEKIIEIVATEITRNDPLSRLSSILTV
jgi:hypothetical protein